MFNTLKYAKILEEVGFSREQSETSIRILAEVMDDKFATKQDLQIMKQDLQLMKSELIVKMGAMQMISAGIIISLLSFILRK